MSKETPRKQADSPTLSRIYCEKHSKDGYWPVDYLSWGLCFDCLFEVQDGTNATVHDVALQNKGRVISGGQGS